MRTVNQRRVFTNKLHRNDSSSSSKERELKLL
jgi:hypothetical protein